MINKDDIEKLSIDDLFNRLATNEKGLSREEAEKRLKQYGYNSVEEKKDSFLKILKNHLFNVINLILLIAALLSILVNQIFNAYIIVALIIFNSLMGSFQENTARKAIDELKKQIRVRCKVLRDSQWIVVDSSEIVPGDIIRVRVGDFVPADSKIIDGFVEVDQSQITGESLTVNKSKNDLLFSGSIIRKGEANALVILTGKNTFYGKTIELISNTKPRLRIEKVVEKVIFDLFAVVLILVLITGLYFYFRGLDIESYLILSIVLIVAAVPVALPPMFSISLALGSKELSKKGVLVRKLEAIEGAATMTLLATDKTGTLTKNSMKIVDLITIGDCSKEDLILYARLASNDADNDPIDNAIISYYNEMHINVDSVKIERFLPFDPSTRRTEAFASVNNREIHIIKGSVDTLANIFQIDKEALSNAQRLALSGYKIIAVAIDDRSMRGICGFIVLSDPLRDDTPYLIKELKENGIKVVMLTGDIKEVASRVAQEAGIGSKIILPNELYRTADLPIDADGIAQVYPEDKYNIVRSFQQKGYVTGMTGDGVNDAPALNQADVGIAVSNATDVAKSAASVILTSEGLKDIVSMISIGRAIYERVNIWIRSKIIRTFQNVIFIVLALILLSKEIITAFDMLLILFLYDFISIVLSTDNVRASSKPATWNINGSVIFGLLLGGVMIVEAFAVYPLFSSLPIAELQTAIMLYLLYSNIFNLLNIRERGNFWVSRPSRALSIAMIADMIIIFLIGAFGFLYVKSIPVIYIIEILILAGLLNLVVNNFAKIYIIKLLDKLGIRV
ncbi:MAG: plasma-membrane proton-efflux P-type ATPase [Candidatus Micrarchaeota archaeon]|nr:MAG: plasma-membrane proton-efflux P-type ATPase [Candidatus Micrarchaeota archaeon]